MLRISPFAVAPLLVALLLHVHVTDAQSALVASSAELLQALSSTDVDTIILTSSIVLSIQDWSGVTTVDRNVTVTSNSAEGAAWPVLSMQFLRSRVVLSPGNYLIRSIKWTRIHCVTPRSGDYVLLKAPP